MHLSPIDAHNTSSPPTISVFGTEVPLPTYFQIVDRHTAGHNTESIIVHMVATRPISNIEILRETVEGIVLNLQLIKHSSSSYSSAGSDSLSLLGVGCYENDSRRNSRIEFVGELDDLSSVHLMAEAREEQERTRERERLSLRKRLFAKLA